MPICLYVPMAGFTRAYICVCMSEIVYVGRHGYLYVLVMNVCLFCICLFICVSAVC